MPEKFDNRYRKCPDCGYMLSVYQYPYTDSEKTDRDFSRCLSCRYESALGCQPRPGVRVPDGTMRRHVEG